ncbi:MAG: 30S ribosomal protein S8 [Bordetella sp.]|nr:MAG: 30S ribosomal protein S8 [Bordetella sp.]
MSMSDPIADMLTRIRNAYQIRKHCISMYSSKLKLSIAKVLKSEGYIDEFEIKDVDTAKPQLKIFLKYYAKRPVIEEIRRISRPGLRIYKHYKAIPYVMNGLGIAIISTSKGVMSDKQARLNHVGGEILCYIA